MTEALPDTNPKSGEERRTTPSSDSEPTTTLVVPLPSPLHMKPETLEEEEEVCVVAKTKQKTSSRAEIDTSHPFESVKEAVNLFGGSGIIWRPPNTNSNSFDSPLPDDGHGFTEFDVTKVEEEASLFEKDLIIKERETLEVLKELETTKRIVEELKVKLYKEESSVKMEVISDDMKTDTVGETEKAIPENQTEAQKIPANDFSMCPSSSPGLILMELRQAKVNLSKTTGGLADIRASVESLHKKLEKERTSLKKTHERLTSNSAKVSSLEEELNRTKQRLHLAKDAKLKVSSKNPLDISKEIEQLNSEVELFKKMADVAKSEISRAMSEVEGTKRSIKTTEIKCIAAKKMAEAARAVEAVALAEIKALSTSENSSGVLLQKSEGITLSFEEYSSLIHKAREAEELSNKRVLDAMVKIDEANVLKSEILKSVEAAAEEVKNSKMALEEALERVKVANSGKLAVEESLRKWRSEHGHKRRSIYNSTKFKNSYPSHHRRDSHLIDANGLNMANDKSKPVLRPTLSIGQILNRKLLMPEESDVEMLTEVIMEKPKVSLGQMLGKHSEATSPQKSEEGSSHMQFPAKRKKFELARFSRLLTKQSKKKKKQGGNQRWTTCKGEVQDIPYMKS